MNAPAAAATPAPNAAEAQPSTSETLESTNINDVFEQVADKAEARNAKAKRKGKPKAKAAPEVKAEEQEPTEAAEEPEPEAAEEEEHEKHDAEQISAEELFSDEALSSPEGLRRARAIALVAKEYAETRSKQLDSFDIRLKARAKSVVEREKKVDDFDKKQRAIGRAFHAELQTIFGLRETNPLGIFQSLDRVAGGNGSAEAGRELFERMNLAYAREGKLPQKTRGEQELERQLEALRQENLRRDHDAQEQQVAAQTIHLQREIQQAELFAGKQANSPTSAPWIAAWIADGRTTEEEVGEYIGNLMEGGLDLAAAIGTLESRLVPPGTKPPTRVEPGAAPSKPRTNGKAPLTTVLPTAADASTGSMRELSADERRARNARDPEFWKAWGLEGVAFPQS